MNRFRDISYGVMLMMLALMYYPADGVIVFGLLLPWQVGLAGMSAMIHFVYSGLSNLLSYPTWVAYQWFCKRWAKPLYVSKVEP